MGRITKLWQSTDNLKRKNGNMCMYNVLNEAYLNKQNLFKNGSPITNLVLDQYLMFVEMDSIGVKLQANCIYQLVISKYEGATGDVHISTPIEIKNENKIKRIRSFDIIEQKIIGNFCSN